MSKIVRINNIIKDSVFYKYRFYIIGKKMSITRALGRPNEFAFFYDKDAERLSNNIQIGNYDDPLIFHFRRTGFILSDLLCYTEIENFIVTNRFIKLNQK